MEHGEAVEQLFVDHVPTWDEDAVTDWSEGDRAEGRMFAAAAAVLHPYSEACVPWQTTGPLRGGGLYCPAVRPSQTHRTAPGSPTHATAPAHPAGGPAGVDPTRS